MHDDRRDELGWAQSGAESVVVVVNKYYEGAFGMRMQRYWYRDAPSR